MTPLWGESQQIVNYEKTKQVSSESDNGKLFKTNRGIRRTLIKCKRHPKMKICSKFHLNRTTGKRLKIGKWNWRNAGGNFEKKKRTTQMASQNKYM